MDNVKCRWTHCRHDSRELSKQDAILIGRNSYYHKDCYHEKETIEQVLTLYKEKIDPNPIWNYLRGVVNNLIFKNGNSADYVLFSLQYAVNHRFNIRNPAGLYYIAKNSEIEDAWKRRKATSSIKKTEFIVEDDLSKVDGYSNSGKGKGFGAIIRR